MLRCEILCLNFDDNLLLIEQFLGVICFESIGGKLSCEQSDKRKFSAFDAD